MSNFLFGQVPGKMGGAGMLPPSFFAPMSSSLTLVRGIGDYSFEGTDVAPSATVTDFEGIVHNCKANEARFPGSRRVENLLPAFNSSEWTALATGGTWGEDGPNGEASLSLTATSGQYIDASAYAGNTHVTSFYVRVDVALVSGETFGLYDGNAQVLTTVFDDTTQPAVGTWIRVTTGAVVATNIPANGRLGFALIYSSAGNVTVSKPQTQDVTGQTLGELGIPGEYVSVGVGTGSELVPDDMQTLDSTATGSTNPDWNWSSSGWEISTAGQIEQQVIAQAILTDELAVAGKLYVVTWTWAGSDALAIAIGGSLFTGYFTAGTHTKVHRATSSAASVFQISGPSDASGVLSNVSIKEIDHGSNVDGVQYFDYHNTLEVVDNVVIGTGGRGAELITNGDFSSSETGWTFTQGGVVDEEAFVDTASLAFESVAVAEVGAFYEILVTRTGVGATAAGNISCGGTTLESIPSAGRYRRVVKATTATALYKQSIRFYIGATGFDNISVKKIDVPNSYAQGTTFGRMVENLVTSDFSDAAWTKDNCTVTDQGDGSWLIEHTVSTSCSLASAIFNIPIGNTGVSSFELKSVNTNTGTPLARLSTPVFGGTQDTITVSDSEFTRFSDIGTVAIADVFSVGINISNSVVGNKWIIRNPQIENVTGLANQNPGEYVSKGVDVYPFTGTGLDGVAEFSTTNPNEVDGSNVVTATATTYPVTPPKKLLIEEARTNLCRYSEDLSNAAWTLNNVTITTGSVTAPDGTLSANIMTDDATNGVHRAYQSATTATTKSCKTIFAKAGTANFVSLSTGNNVDSYATFDLNLGVVSNEGSGGVGTITPMANAWYRCELLTTDNSAYMNVAMGTTAEQAKPTTGAYVGSGDTVYVWGAQKENDVSFPSTYIPTTTAAVLRDADLLEYPAANYSNEMTVVLEFTLERDAADGVTKHLLLFQSDGSVPLLLYLTNFGILTLVELSGGIRNQTHATTLAAGRHRLVFTRVDNVSAIPLAYIDGVPFSNLGGAGTFLPVTCTGIKVGVSANDITPINGTIGDIKIYNKLLSAEKAQELSKVESD